VKFSFESLAILRLLSRHEGFLYGAEIMTYLELPSGTTYPILHRLEDEGFVISKIEKGNSHAIGRPARRFYWITRKGNRQCASMMRTLNVFE